jgi:hypothetical protein
MKPYDMKHISSMNKNLLRLEYFAALHNGGHMYTKTALIQHKFHITYRQIQ